MLEDLYDAIANGLRTPGSNGKLEELEARQAEIELALSAPAPSPARLHPNLSEMYRRKVTALTKTLSDPEIRTSALEAIRGLIKAVRVHITPEGIKLELEGALSVMISLAQDQSAKSPAESGAECIVFIIFFGCGDRI